MKPYILIFALFMQACAMGPRYEPAPEPKTSESLIYFMRGDIQYGGGYPLKFKIDDFEIVGLYDFGYSWTHIPSGEYTFKAGGERLKMNIEAGKTYYIEFHQEVSVTSNNLIKKKNIFRNYKKEEIAEQLKESRFKESTPINIAEKSNYSDFISRENLTDFSEVRFKFSKSGKASFVSNSANIYKDSNECSTGKSSFTDEFIQGEYFKLEPNELHTLELRSKQNLFQYYLLCNERITAKFNTGKKYTIHSTILVDEKAKNFGSCHYEIINETDNVKVEFYPRTIPFTFTGSKACKANDLEPNNLVLKYDAELGCRVRKTSGTTDC